MRGGGGIQDIILIRLYYLFISNTQSPVYLFQVRTRISFGFYRVFLWDRLYCCDLLYSWPILWNFMQSMPITSYVVILNLDQGKVYNIMWSSLSVICDRSVVFSGPPVSYTNKTDSHNITEILLKVALNTIKQTNNL